MLAVFDGETSGQSSDGATLWITAEGELVRKSARAADLCTTSGPVTYGTLREPSYFEACRAEPSAFDRFDCLREAMFEAKFECSPAEESCSEF